MDKTDFNYQIDLIIDYADSVLARYISYFYKNDIDRTKNRENNFVKIYYEIYDIKRNKVYECKNIKDFENLKNYILKARDYLDNNK